MADAWAYSDADRLQGKSSGAEGKDEESTTTQPFTRARVFGKTPTAASKVQSFSVASSGIRLLMPTDECQHVKQP